jgi:hypothetical protein
MAPQVRAVGEAPQHHLDSLENALVIGVGAQEDERVVESRDPGGIGKAALRQRGQQFALESRDLAAEVVQDLFESR